MGWGAGVNRAAANISPCEPARLTVTPKTRVRRRLWAEKSGGPRPWNQSHVYSVYIVVVYTVDMAKRSTAGRIAAAAGRLLHREGADAVTMRRVAKAVNITPMAVYRHYADRDGLLNALADAGFKDFATRLQGAAMPTDPERRLTAILNVFLDFGLEKPRLFELMFLRRREGARQFPGDFRAGRSPTAKFAAAALEAGMKSGAFRKDDIWEITFETGALLQGLVMLYAGGRVGTSAEEFRALCHRAFRRYLYGIRR
jgi:AcrR family transcriptional regulator